MLTEENFAPGMCVQRGPDWRWANQDSHNNYGVTLPKKAQQGWCFVLWQHQHENCYRIGAKGCFDLRVVSGPQAVSGVGGFPPQRCSVAQPHEQIDPQNPLLAQRAPQGLGGAAAARRWKADTL